MLLSAALILTERCQGQTGDLGPGGTMLKRHAIRPWIGVVALIGASLALGWILVFISTGKNDARRDIGVSLIGSSVIGFALVLVGQLLATSSRQQDFLFTISEKSDLTGIDLRGRDLAGQYLVGKNLTRANLSGADLRQANLASSILRQADLTGARLDRAIMMDADLSGAYLMNASMTFTLFQNATLDHAVMPFTQLRGTVFTEASLRSAILAGARFSPGKVASFTSALRARVLVYSPFSARSLRKGLAQARMLYPETTPKSVSDVRRYLAVSLERAVPVNLFKTDLTECDLRGADLREVDLTRAELCEVFWDDQTRWPHGFEPPPRNQGQPSTAPMPWRNLDNRQP